MKLKAIYLFFLLLAVLILISSLGSTVKTEGFKNNTEEFVKDLTSPFDKKQKKYTDDHSDIYDYQSSNSNKYQHPSKHPKKKLKKTKSSYIGPAGDTVIIDGPTQGPYPAPHPAPYPLPKPKHKGSLGIPYSQIPAGEEDMYILKTEVIPPVCPMCPSIISTCPNNNASPPPCPPCARCPEPAFDCKKVPNYKSNDNQYLPVPVLADFSQFGM